ncbi:hypothetical protein WJ967_10415 [Achromobacter xylosoxidans]
MQPSRRAFLLGRRPVQTPWATFLQRLALLCQGAVRDLGEAPGLGPRAMLAPQREADVAQARALCAEYGVVMALDEAQGPFAPVSGPLLAVDPGRLAGLARLAGPTPRWRAQPGVPLAALAQAGLRQFDGLPGSMTLAQWLAAPAAWSMGRCADSGVLAVDLLLADGVEETLGPLARTTCSRCGRRRCNGWCRRCSSWPQANWPAPAARRRAGARATAWMRWRPRRPPPSTWRIWCWDTAARWPGCRG